MESAAYFAVSELLANVTKHAHAGQAWIDLRHEGGRRLAAFDGMLAVSSPPGGPTMITVEIPCVLSP